MLDFAGKSSITPHCPASPVYTSEIERVRYSRTRKSDSLALPQVNHKVNEKGAYERAAGRSFTESMMVATMLLGTCSKANGSME